MPRVYTKVKSTRGAPRTCGKCGKRIEPKQRYYEWGFRYGGTYRRHVDCGYPKMSELTQSKMSTVLASIEDAEEQLPSASTFDEIAELAEAVAESAREVAEEYREAVRAMNMEGAGTENEERADQLDSYADELDQAASEIRDKESEVDDRHQELQREEGLDVTPAESTDAEVEEMTDEELETEAAEDADRLAKIEELHNTAEEELLEEARGMAQDAWNNQPF